MSREPGQPAAGDMALIAACANHLMQTNPAFVQVIATMLAARQLYTAGVYELDVLLNKVDLSKLAGKLEEAQNSAWTDGHKTLLKEILINASVAKTYESFDSKTLMKGLVETVLPWLTRVTTEHTQLQAEEQKKENLEKELERLRTKIDIGFGIYDGSNEAEATKIARDGSLLLVGKSNVVRWFLQRVASNLLDYGSGASQLLHLTTQQPKMVDPSLLSLPEKLWANCTATNTSFQQLYEASIFNQLTNPVDVVLVDDISVAYRGLAFTPVLSRTNEAQHRLKKWTKEAGALLISGLPLERELKPNELHLPDFELLKTHNILRAIAAAPVEINGEDFFKITVGIKEVAVISAEELESFNS